LQVATRVLDRATISINRVLATALSFNKSEMSHQHF